MTTENNNLGTSSTLLFGAVIPLTTNHSDNDTYLLTSNGTVTGTITREFKFDGDTSAWVEIPLGSSCPAPMTRAALLSLRGSSSLSKDCHYVITDYSRPVFGAATILLHAVNSNTLSQNVSVVTQFDAAAFAGRYDFDTNRIMELSDDRGNIVVGEIPVDNFPWGVSTVTENTVNEATFNYVAGTVNQITLEGGATLTMNGGSVENSIIGELSNVTINSGEFDQNTVGGDVTIISSTTADVKYCEFHNLCAVTISGTANVLGNQFHTDSTTIITDGTFYYNSIGNQASVTSSSPFTNNVVGTDATIISSTTGIIDQNEFYGGSAINFSDTCNMNNSKISGQSTLSMSGTSQAVNLVSLSRSVINLTNDGEALFIEINKSTLTISGGELQSSVIEGNCNVTITNGLNLDNTFTNRATYNQVGTGWVRYSRIGGNNIVTNGDTNIDDLNCWNTHVNTTGSTGTIDSCSFHNATMSSMTNVVLLDMLGVSVFNSSSFTITGAQRVFIRYLELLSVGRILVSAGASLDIDSVVCSTRAYIQVTLGSLLVQRSQITSTSYIRQSSTGSNWVLSTKVGANSNVFFQETSTGCRVFYCNVNDSSFIQLRGTSTDCWISNCTVESGGYLHTDDSLETNINFCHVSSNSSLIASLNTFINVINNCKSTAGSSVQCTGNSALVTMTNLTADSGSIVSFRNTAVASSWSNSSFQSQYRIYVTKTTVNAISGLHGYGLRSIVVVDPANGTFVQNF